MTVVLARDPNLATRATEDPVRLPQCYLSRARSRRRMEANLRSVPAGPAEEADISETAPSAKKRRRLRPANRGPCVPGAPPNPGDSLAFPFYAATRSHPCRWQSEAARQVLFTLHGSTRARGEELSLMRKLKPSAVPDQAEATGGRRPGHPTRCGSARSGPKALDSRRRLASGSIRGSAVAVGHVGHHEGSRR